MIAEHLTGNPTITVENLRVQFLEDGFSLNGSSQHEIIPKNKYRFQGRQKLKEDFQLMFYGLLLLVFLLGFFSSWLTSYIPVLILLWIVAKR